MTCVCVHTLRYTYTGGGLSAASAPCAFSLCCRDARAQLRARSLDGLHILLQPTWWFFREQCLNVKDMHLLSSEAVSPDLLSQIQQHVTMYSIFDRRVVVCVCVASSVLNQRLAKWVANWRRAPASGSALLLDAVSEITLSSVRWRSAPSNRRCYRGQPSRHTMVSYRLYASQKKNNNKKNTTKNKHNDWNKVLRFHPEVVNMFSGIFLFCLSVCLFVCYKGLFFVL